MRELDVARLAGVLAEQNEVLRAVRDELAALRAERSAPRPQPRLVPPREPRPHEAQFLTKRAAARVLGVNRSDTLRLLLLAGVLRTVPFLGKRRIPREEVERVKREGIPTLVELRRRAQAAQPEPSVKPGKLESWQHPTERGG